MAQLQNLVSIEKITQMMGGKLLFQDLTLGIAEGEKIALIGNNGCGKSTLLKLIAGLIEVEEGRISRRQGCEIAYLEQKPVAKEGQSILDFVLENNSPLFQTVKNYESTAVALSHNPSEANMAAFEQAGEAMNQIEGWGLEQKIKSVLERLGIDDLERPTLELSGGMLKKVAMARALVQEAPLLLLDEPTNHLDIETISWLEEELKQRQQTLILVTHDRYFLNNICTKIIEIDEQQLFQYNGNYAFYMEEREARHLRRLRDQERINSILRTELEWLKRGPKARTGKDSARKERIFQMMEKRSIQGQEIAKSEQKSEAFSVKERHQGSKVLKIEGLTKSFPTPEGGERTIIKPFSFEFTKGDRIGIVGPNGSGKTTFLNLIAGQLAPDGGTLDYGIHTHIAYFDQLSNHLRKDKKVLELFDEIAKELPTRDGQRVSPTLYLERFLFPKEQYNTLIGDLSGGEQRRLYLLSLLLTEPNFLILDEPTNDLDIQTLSLLEDFLIEFKGNLLIVSHDRYFLDRTIDTLFCLDGKGNIEGFAGDITQYQLYLKEKSTNQNAAVQASSVATESLKSDNHPKNHTKKGLSFKEKQEYEQIEPKLTQLEAEKADLEAYFSKGKSDPNEFVQKEQRYSEIDGEIEALMTRWEELEAKL